MALKHGAHVGCAFRGRTCLERTKQMLNTKHRRAMFNGHVAASVGVGCSCGLGARGPVCTAPDKSDNWHPSDPLRARSRLLTSANR